MSESFRALLDERMVARLLGVSRGTLQVWRSTKRVPLKFVKVGRLVRYRVSDIEDYVASRTVEPSEPRQFIARRKARKEHISRLKSVQLATSQKRKASQKRTRT